MNELVQAGQAKLERWIEAKKRIEGLRRDMNSAECELSNATNDLGAWMMPKDAKDGETFNVWITDGILQATRLGCGPRDFEVKWRTEPSLKQGMKMGI